MRASVEYALCS